MAHSTEPHLLQMDKADDIWQCVKGKVASVLCGPGVTAVPYLRDSHMFRPLCVIGKRVERSLLRRRRRSLFPLGPLHDLLDDPRDLPEEVSLQTDGPVRCDFLHEEFMQGVGRVRVQVSHISRQVAVCPLPPQLPLKDDLPWLDSVHRLYLVSHVYCSSDVRLRVLGLERRTELRLGPNTPLAFCCLRLSACPSGLVEMCEEGWQVSYLHPWSHWARFGSPGYNALVAGRQAAAEPRVMGLLSQLAFSISDSISYSSLSLPTSAIHLAPSPSSDHNPHRFHSRSLLSLHHHHQANTEYRENQVIDTQALLPLDEEEGG